MGLFFKMRNVGNLSRWAVDWISGAIAHRFWLPSSRSYRGM